MQHTLPNNEYLGNTKNEQSFTDYFVDGLLNYNNPVVNKAFDNALDTLIFFGNTRKYWDSMNLPEDVADAVWFDAVATLNDDY